MYIWIASQPSLLERCVSLAEIHEQDRATSSATGTILFIDFKAEKLWAAQIGKPGQLVLGQLFHGLAAQRTRAVMLDNALR